MASLGKPNYLLASSLKETLFYIIPCSLLTHSREINDTRYMFEVIPGRNVVYFTSFFSGLMNAGQIDEARKLFDVMSKLGSGRIALPDLCAHSQTEFGWV